MPISKITKCVRQNIFFLNKVLFLKKFLSTWWTSLAHFMPCLRDPATTASTLVIQIRVFENINVFEKEINRNILIKHKYLDLLICLSIVWFLCLLMPCLRDPLPVLYCSILVQISAFEKRSVFEKINDL